MNDFTKNITQALFNQDKINDLLRHEIQQAVNDLLESELTAFLGYDPYASAAFMPTTPSERKSSTCSKPRDFMFWSSSAQTSMFSLGAMQ